ncbi:YraN family protein [Candidatus Gracilibacteria bacterium]|nr:YraN family protein [Candidatus Gracilibacteria bacterium]MCF7856642.1 YraN family protein [Candidatus Gracilibacteria bacterium]MCF7896959.1 YraN family protein [Candidatus Gracilibacteria bacterium]
MNFTKNFGNDGEILAKKFLENRGLEILATNFHSKDGEVDLICRDGSKILFVEVKARRSSKFGSAIESVTDSKIDKIVAAGEKFLLDNSLENFDWRVDVITIEDGTLKWIKGI